MRILDLGCGQGRDLASWGISASDEVTGLDVDAASLTVARTRFPNRKFLRGAGERLPFAEQSFDRVVSGVAVPYMNIPRAIAEIYRVLVPGGGLSLSLHLPSFTWAEFRNHALPRPVPMIFRLYVAVNGVVFHSTGKTVGFLNGRTESFQTQRGMKLALGRAGFVNPSFRRENCATGERFLVEATKPAMRSLGAARAA